jgi:phenylacetic acid degradation operon negative regulatory protein
MSPTENKPVLRLTDEGMASSTDSLRPHRYWDRKWRGIWYVLVYDVPEDERQFRDTLRNFLRKMRMGCLQRSVYITPHDIRPQYDDLMKAARVEVVSFLFESSTVLGRHPDEVIFSAWDFDRINSIHQRYISTYEHNINAMLSTTLTKQTLRDLAHEEMLAYQTAMADDPLLPQQLLPHDYFGFRVFDLHRTFVRHTKHLLRTAKQD